ncbi:uncharacterized protein PHACADRAFT_261451 [Phanerochaete carnosa HHB-10118-sp]|uniref:Mating-type-like pheromone receptor n=1 Tax=Phanerochaete carnosa (strain HHB-10118-sp) TaxID=650164 RepID=K5W1S2_PHACS|nr:uncharacterized protein PHACADRAFT_261451 [Phanerochaete carnosa HHB-10118-sp]EKM52809.1 hypothetical protein PHACADRAFT_261451 [Phanerochaete carnosa HHB-10118-sp]
MGLPWSVQQAIYTAFCGLGFILSYIPLYWHLEAWNMGAVLWVFWSGTGCLIYFVNGIIWHDNTIDCAPVWCDIVTRFMQAQPIGTTIASALINHRLYKLTKLSVTHTTAADKRRMGIIDLSIGLGIPAIFMGTYWFVQGHRFDIFEGVGCAQDSPLTYVWIFTYGIWPTIITTISACFGVMTILAFMRHRKEIDILVSEKHRSLTSYRYFRLMVFASVDVLFLLPLTIFLLFEVVTTQDLYPWNGLADLHFDFSNVLQIPADSWRARQGTINQVLTAPGTAIGSSLVFFAFFGMAKEARVHYRKAFNALRRKCGALCARPRFVGEKLPSTPEPPRAGGGGISHLSMPSFVQRIPTALGLHKKRSGSLSSVFSISVTVEDLTVSDVELGAARPPAAARKPTRQVYDNEDVPTSELDDGYGAPMLSRPPGLVPVRHDSLPMTPDSRLQRPPSHSFHGPRSVTSTMNTLDAL